ncbi:MAG UNVERIFIED_CONTAM: hypothetical protein LVT10_23965 [Anaerolineae bacterium]
MPAILKSWDVIPAPQPIPNTDHSSCVSEWISINFLSLDGERIIVAKDQTNLIALLKDHGMKPIPIDFDAYYPFLGSNPLCHLGYSPSRGTQVLLLKRDFFG